jgi:dUTP pyrophosphatase
MDFFFIKKGDRIAQMILLQYNEMEFDYVEQFDITDRGDGGFGSTGQ